METDRDTTRIVRSWLEEGRTTLPDRVLDAVLDRVPATPQRRPWWPVWRTPPMNTSAKLAIGMAAVAVVAVVGIGVLSGRGAVGPGGTVPASSPLPKLGMPGHTASPAGMYGSQLDPGGRTRMHNVVETWTEIEFAALEDCFAAGEWSEPVPVTIGGLDALSVEPYRGDPSVPLRREPQATTAAYALPVGDRMLCAYLSWGPATTPTELDAARAVIRSIQAQPVGRAIRFVFTTEAGWDTG
jgi:hypothetical protein